MTEAERDELIRRMAADMAAIRRALEPKRDPRLVQEPAPTEPHASAVWPGGVRAVRS